MDNIKKAHSIFTKVFVGLVIILAAWVVIDIIMKTLTNNGATIGPWNSISCERYVQGGVLSNAPAFSAIPLSEQALTCDLGTGACAPAQFSAFGENARAASRICQQESGANAGKLSVTDIMRTNDPQHRSFSVGLFQINMTKHNINARACTPNVLNCTEAFQGSDYDARVVNETLYNQCVTALQDPRCNTAVAGQIFAGDNQSWRQWSTAQCGHN